MRSIRCRQCHRLAYSAALPNPTNICSECGGRLEALTDVWDEHPDPRLANLPPALCAVPDSYTPADHSYPSLREFVKAKRGRAPSAEVDVGLRWLDSEGHGFRAAWVVDTCELILVQWGKADEGAGHVEVLAVVADQDQLEIALGPWRDVCGTAGSLEWLRSRVAARLAAPPPRE